MADKDEAPEVTREGVTIIKLPKLTRAQSRGIKALREWERRSTLGLLGRGARDRDH